VKIRTRREKKPKRNFDWIPAFLTALFLILLLFGFSIDGFDKFRFPKNAIFYFMTAVLLSAAILLKGSLSIRFRFFSWEFLVLCGVAYIGLHFAVSNHPSVSLDGFLAVATAATLLGLLIQLLSPVQLQNVWLVLGASVGINGVFTALQYLGYFPIMEDPGGSLAFGRMNPAGFIGEVNSGGFLFGLVCFPLIFFLVESKKMGLRWFAAVLIILNLVGLAFTRTLTAVAATLVCSLLWLAFHHVWTLRQPGRSWKDLLVLWIVLILGTIGGGFVAYRTGLVQRAETVVSQIQEGNWTIATAGRAPVFRLTWEMIEEKPFVGRGMNSFPGEFFRFRTETETGRSIDLLPQPGAFRQAHNEYLQTWAELGIVGFLLLLGALFLPLYRAYVYVRHTAATETTYWVALLSIGLVYTAIGCFAFFPMHVAVCAVPTLLIAAGLRRATAGESQQPEAAGISREFRFNRRVSILLAVVLSLGVGAVQLIQWRANIEVGNAAGLLDRVTGSQLDARRKRVVGEEVLRRLDMAEARSRNFHEIDSLRGTAYFILNRPKQAVESYRRAIRQIPSPELLTNMAAAYMSMKDFEAARKCVRLALAYDPSNPKARQAARFLKNRKSG